MIDTLHLRGSRYEDVEFEFPSASALSDKEKGDEEASVISLESEDDDVGLAAGSATAAAASAGGGGKGKIRPRRDPRKLKSENSFQVMRSADVYIFPVIYNFSTDSADESRAHLNHNSVSFFLFRCCSP